jgi:deoxycytidylate deaminase
LSDPLTDEFSTPELFFGLVGAIGTDLRKVADILKKALKDEVDYETKAIKLSTIVTPEKEQKESDRYKKYLFKMQAGTDTRNFYNRPDAVVLKGLNEVRALRREENSKLTLPAETNPAELPIDRTAFVFHSLKRPEEVDTLRRVYGQSFYLIGAYSPRETRVVKLAESIASSRHKQNTEQFRTQAEELIEKDRADQGEKLGQAVQKTFPEADIFINIENEDEAKELITRFIRLIFSDAFFTPSKNEQAMFFARAAALRSADLGRQVGAVIISVEGDVLSTGTNEIPKALGGQYWEGDNPDKRDFRAKYDSNDKMKKALIGDVASQLSSEVTDAIKKIVEQCGQTKLSQAEIDALIAKTVSQPELTRSIEKSQIVNLIAYFRAIHGEMAAIIDAARRGVSVRGSTLVCTTFPCHECARHIVGAGIKRVIYIEP